MESNAMSGGMYSGLGSGMIGLEMSLHHHIPKQNAQNPTHNHMQQNPHHHPNMVAYAHHPEGEIQPPQAQLSSAKQGGYNPFGTKPKNQSLSLSDDDQEPGAGLATENSAADDGKRKMSPWQRMKWTDNMVRLLIMVVFYIGDEAGSEGNNNDPAGKKKVGGSGSGVVLQKKGKWKSVSRAMMERGFYVSPQQCEDKFNDLNKRYKRVNDILGKGTACRVVENQSLLETMDHLSPKMKEEAKKLLNSKHLFFREMCAYHNSCGHATAGAQQSPEIAAPEPCHQGQQQSQTRCLHSTEIATSLGSRGEMEDGSNSKLAKGGGGSREEEEEEEEVYADDDDEDDDDDDEEDDEDDDTDDRSGRKKRRRKGNVVISPLIQQLSSELSNVFQDETKSAFEKRQWMKNRLMQLEEQHVGYEYQTFELEKQRLKWLKFSNKKDREMERDKLSNDRMKLENERMSLLIRQKEIELLDLYQQQQTSRKSDPSSITG